MLDAPLDAAGHLSGDLSCVKCGYNLRTLHCDAACPECGTAVGRSIEGNRLRYCDPAWLKQIWEGLNCFGVAVAAAIVLVVVVIKSSRGTPLIWIVGPLSLMLGLAIYGLVKATHPDPARVDHEWLVSARRVARVAWLAALLFAGTLLVSLATVPIWEQSERVDMIRMLCVIVATIAMFVGSVSLLAHAARLAQRLPNRALTAAIVAVNVYQGLVVVLGLIYAWDWFWDWLWDLSVAAGYGYRYLNVRYRIEEWMPLLLLLFAGMLVALLAWYWWALSRAARHAWATWARRMSDC